MSRPIAPKCHIVAVLLPLLTACQQQPAHHDSRLDPNLIALSGEVERLKLQVSDLERRAEFSETLDSMRNTAVLEPGSAGFSMARFDLGVLLLSLQDVRPYANGTKVVLHIGNPTTARVKGLKARVEWGPLSKDGKFDNAAAKAKEAVFLETLQPGTWSNYEVVLEGLPPEHLGFVRVRNFTLNSVELRKP